MNGIEALDALMNYTLDVHKIDRWDVELNSTKWVVCSCGQVDVSEDFHRVHVARCLADVVEANINKLASKLIPDPANNATTSRDYGRGFAEAVRQMKEILDEPPRRTVLDPHADPVLGPALPGVKA